MFTGIITNLGKIIEISNFSKSDSLVKISVQKNQLKKRSLQIGCSIACNGICLTLIKKQIFTKEIVLSFQASKETAKVTNLKNWKIGDLINLEFSLKIGDELGGHFVLGHVDDVAKITAIKKIKNSYRFSFLTTTEINNFIAKKCSITIDGVSLTVNEVNKNNFSVNLIDHTVKNTNFSDKKIGNLVNLEIDVIARYLEKMNKKYD
jgi:riboflavin synthase